MPNLDLVPKPNLSSFRRIAIGTWRTVGDPSVYGTMALRADKVLAYIDEVRRKTGRKATITHFMAKAVAHILEQMPDANAILRFNKIYLRQTIGVFFQVAMEDEKTGEIDLSGTVIFDGHKKSLVQVVDEFAAKVTKVRSGKDETLEETRSTFKKIPFLLLNKFLDTLSFFLYTLNLDLSGLGLPKDPFGSAMVTNIGTLGLEEAYAPLVPYSKVPLLLAVGAVRDEAVVEDGKIVIGKVLRVNATFDHRVLDGMHASKMSKTLRAIFDNPEQWFGKVEEQAALPAATSAAAPSAS